MLDLAWDNRVYEQFDAYQTESLMPSTTIFDPAMKRVKGSISLPFLKPRYEDRDVITEYGDDIDYSGYKQPYTASLISGSIPNVLQLDLTDKTSSGVFESRPVVAKESFLSRLTQAANFDLPPENATLLRNPAVEGFETAMWSNPLEANYMDKAGQASGQDPASFYFQDVPAGATVGPILAPSILGAGSQAAIDALPAPLRVLTDTEKTKSVLKESGVFILGLIILAVGIFALTR